MNGESPSRGARVLIVAGEASGDSHGAGLVREVLARDPGVSFFGLAGPAMERAGVESLVSVSDVTVVGILEVVRHLPSIWSAWRRLTEEIRRRRPDLVLLIDFPDFNLLLARRARRLGIPVLYFVSPQLWAWREGRIRTIANRVDRMMVLFRFEEEVYRKAGVPVTWVGHPLADEPPARMTPAEARGRLSLPADGRVISLLPGSREGEVERILPSLTGAAGILASEEPDLSFLLPAAPTLDPRRLETMCAGSAIRVVPDDLDAVLAASDAAAVASGTATLQVALSATPFVVVYKVSPLTAAIGRRFIRVKDIGLVNLVAGRRVVEELVQEDCTPGRIAGAIRWLLEPEAAAAARHGLATVRERLGEPGAFARAASVTLEMLGRGGDSGRRQ